MVQEKVTRKELLEMHIGQTRIFTLKAYEKLQSTAVTINQLKNERKGEWTCKKDYYACAVSVTRTK